MNFSLSFKKFLHLCLALPLLLGIDAMVDIDGEY